LETSEYIKSLTNEYRALLIKKSERAVCEPEKIEALLARHGDWSPKAAEHLLNLAKGYGSFMLSNALALSLALGIEDGELGF